MIADLRRYPRMKDSGVPWLGDVPEHWEAARLKGHLVRNDSGVWGDDSDPHGTFVLRSTEQTVDGGWRITNPAKIRLPEAQSEIALLRTGDLVVTKSSGSSAHIGKTSLVSAEVASLRCCFSNFMQRLRVDGVTDPSFLWRLLNSPVGREQLVFQSTTTTGLGNLNGTILGNSRFPFPPLAEQAAIVRFLDHADRRIRRYIRAKQKLIKLLEEQKQAIIHRAVTRGLDPNARLKPSGVEWLGDVPEHWEVWQVGHFAAIGNGSTPSRGNMAYWAGGTYPWLNSGSVNAGMILASDQFVTDTALRECHLPRVPAGSVLVAITGQGKTRGTAAVLTIEATINQHIAFITPRKRRNTATPEYLRAFFVAAYPELRRMSDDSGSTKGALTCEDLRHFRVVLPPLEEQQRIVRWSQDATAEVDSALRLASRDIELVREYRTRLIADVVTGKLDVREAAAGLPDEGEETEPPDEADALTRDEKEPGDDLDALPEEAEV